MKTKIFFLCLSCLVLSISGCKKDSAGTVFSSRFDNATDLNLWTQSSDGEATIVKDYLKLKAVNGCLIFETVDLIPVKKGKTYTLKFRGKVDPTLVGESCHCVGDFMIYIEQGSNFLIMDGFGNYTNWTQKAFSFEAPSSASVKIKFLIGTLKGAWLDDLELIEN